ncbi:hypothetical protein [Janthinobacterium sp.]|uniref:hypothetical protein n=1 Tax=Janthinobacterium sp. TaxID=1871054 RepID=UPI0028A0D6BC|nr:hypothetical protein [Janthinobacterium sp.]
MQKIATVMICACLLSGSAWAFDPVRHEKVALAQGAPMQKLSGKIKGYATVEYSVTAPVGGKLAIRLNSANTSAYFNLSLDGADEALFVGSRDGNRYQGDIAAPGRYKVQVYLMRNAARKNQTASYVLEIGATGT